MGTVFWSGFTRSNFNPDHPISWTWQPILPNLQYNTVEGLVINGEVTIEKSFPEQRKRISLTPHIRYGFSGGLLNAYATLAFRKSSFEWDPNGGSADRSNWSLSGGKRITQFNNADPISPLVNEIYTLFVRDNYMKLYENYYGELKYTNRMDNGLRIAGSLLYEDRIPVNNSTDFSFFGDKNKAFTPNYPYEIMDSQFVQYQALLLGIGLQFRPGQKYIEFPNNKIPIGSKYPLFSLYYQKGP